MSLGSFVENDELTPARTANRHMKTKGVDLLKEVEKHLRNPSYRLTVHPVGWFLAADTRTTNR